MQQYPYWHKQAIDTPLYPDIEWSKPEQRTQAGRLGIIGGNKLGFAGVAEAYSTSLKIGAGDAKALLPEALKRTIPSSFSETMFAPSNISGSLSRDALNDMRALGEWSTGILFVGDAGRSSETAIVYDDFIAGYDGWMTLTRDAVDLVKQSSSVLVDREKTLFVVSFAQLQKLFQQVYYPRMLTFSMQLVNVVDSLHKFTITYPITIVTLHKDHLLVAHGGEVVTMEWGNPMAIWRGNTAAKAATYLLWNQNNPLQAVTTAVREK
jgi:ADP-dependent NAD(P)H-hydrate dehydratase / NAD(P)H-hydrate epimerase